MKKPLVILLTLVLLGLALPVLAGLARGPALIIDVAQLTAGVDPMIRVSGAPGATTTGRLGTPVAGGFDVDGDGFGDYAVGHMTTTVGARPFAGEVELVFGDGTTSLAVDLAAPQGRVLRIQGDGAHEAAGSEVWMGDVTGDGLGDLLVCRQNFNPGGRVGAGSVTVLVGGPALRNLAASGRPLDLRDPPPGVPIVTFYGAAANDRLGIWTRTGDIDGDGIDELVMAADQESIPGERFRGAVYVVRGGPHLANGARIDLGAVAGSPVAGQVAKIVPPRGAADFHFGATLQLGDLDGNGRAELFVAAALNRAGAILSPDGQFSGDAQGGPPGGRLWVIWDDSFPASAPWPADLLIDLATPPASLTTLNGGRNNVSFGEEVLGGLDYDDDGRGDLFIGDLVGDASGSRPVSGVGYVLYRAERLKGRTHSIDDLPSWQRKVTILGPVAGAIGSDTVAHGDFNGDGISDLMIGNPHDNPQGRFHAGSMHVIFGKRGRWPKTIDTAEGRLPPSHWVRVTLIEGAKGGIQASGQGPSPDEGDTLCYSAAAGDVDGDGRTDIITNEMIGNGVAPNAIDVGNLVIFDGAMISAPRPRGHRRGIPETNAPRGDGPDGPIFPIRPGRGIEGLLDGG
ncbi:MAG: hypothetical protein AAF604_19565 [Acidobacteriota bacterium]